MSLTSEEILAELRASNQVTSKTTEQIIAELRTRRSTWNIALEICGLGTRTWYCYLTAEPFMATKEEAEKVFMAALSDVRNARTSLMCYEQNRKYPLAMTVIPYQVLKTCVTCVTLTVVEQ